MVKVNEELFNKVADSANLKTDKDEPTGKKADLGTCTVTVYDVPKSWVNAVKGKPNKQSMAAFAREAIFDKLKSEGLI